MASATKYKKNGWFAAACFEIKLTASCNGIQGQPDKMHAYNTLDSDPNYSSNHTEPVYIIFINYNYDAVTLLNPLYNYYKE